jgi:hypothetical protein
MGMIPGFRGQSDGRVRWWGWNRDMTCIDRDGDGGGG